MKKERNLSKNALIAGIIFVVCFLLGYGRMITDLEYWKELSDIIEYYSLALAPAECIIGIAMLLKKRKLMTVGFVILVLYSIRYFVCVGITFTYISIIEMLMFFEYISAAIVVGFSCTKYIDKVKSFWFVPGFLSSCVFFVQLLDVCFNCQYSWQSDIIQALWSIALLLSCRWCVGLEEPLELNLT